MRHYSDKQKALIGALVGLARSLDESNSTYEAFKAMIFGLKAVDGSEDLIGEAIAAVGRAKHNAVPDCSVCSHPCGRTSDYDLGELETFPETMLEKKYMLIEKAVELAKVSDADGENYESLMQMLTELLFAVGYDWLSEEEIIGIIDKK